VLSAIEGLEVATEAAKPFIVPLTCAVLVALFIVQKRGTAGIGKIFGPVAEESLRAAGVGELNRQELAGFIEKHPSSMEKNLLQEFDSCWGEFRRIDRQVLDFAVQKVIRENDAVVRRSLGEIRPLMPPEKKVLLQQAIAAYDAFSRAWRLRLSRRTMGTDAHHFRNLLGSIYSAVRPLSKAAVGIHGRTPALGGGLLDFFERIVALGFK
jgi:hypothetical protein